MNKESDACALVKRMKEQGHDFEEQANEDSFNQEDDLYNSDQENEIQPIPSDLSDDLDNDIGDEDRQVLNDRVLGIINVY